jgi:hypothetical protein
MKPLYITSVEPYSGKTATCLALGAHMKAEGLQVGYLKPLSLQPWRVGDKIADEDAAFAKEILGLSAEPWELSPIVVTPEFVRQYLEKPVDLMNTIRDACEAAGAGCDVLLLEGGGSLREGYLVGLPTPGVAQALGSSVLIVIKYRDDVSILDDVLAARVRLGEALCGAVINRVPPDARLTVRNAAVPLLEKKGIPIFGLLPDERTLSALTVGELVQTLDAEILTKYYRPQAAVEHLMVGAMTADTALSRFRQYAHKAIITGGDRTDIQLAALETSTTCLVLTGNLRPSPLVVKQAEEFGVAVLLVRANTLETVEAIERVFGKTRLGQASKLKQFQNLMDEHFDYERLYQAIGLR